MRKEESGEAGVSFGVKSRKRESNCGVMFPREFVSFCSVYIYLDLFLLFGGTGLRHPMLF